MARLDVTETFHGISFPGHLHTQDSLQRAVDFEFEDTDILIVSYPKSGKTSRHPAARAPFSPAHTSGRVTDISLFSPQAPHGCRKL